MSGFGTGFERVCMELKVCGACKLGAGWNRRLGECSLLILELDTR